MFGRRHPGRRSTNIVFVIFRMLLSIIMLAALLGGVYSAYKHFSGLDPLKIDPQALVLGIMSKNGNISEIVNKIPFIKGKSKVGSSPREAGENQNISLQNLTSHISNPTSNLVFKFLLVADSHNDNANLKKAITQAKQAHPNLAFIIGLGDYTDVGTLDELRSAKKELDFESLRYFLIPGDHDLWDSRNKDLSPDNNFKQIFGPTYQSFVFDGFNFLLLDNSDDYKGIDSEQIKWLTNELGKKDSFKGSLVFVHEPLFHPSSDHVMGKVEKDLKIQAKNLIREIKDSGVKKVFAGDIHYFSEYEEPETKIPMVTVGAITSDRNPQAPRYAIVWVFEDGSIKVEDIEIR